MKKTLLILTAAILLSACKKSDDKPKTGSIEVKLSYFYNDFQGYKADVGARIYLFKQTGKSYDKSYVNYSIGALQVSGSDEIVYYDYRAEADVTGTAKIDNVPYGKYLLVAASKGRFVYSVKPIEVNSVSQNFVKNFGYLHEFDDNGESW
ncbi:hypothetical protein FW774_17260 [Pedobacter sp. BS3]|uniref:hypothetical protein n=1 Tax=Pedobacter sp. BS3 TaxID=2567937 RepID=UPI0011ECD46E|nr:hypothetical protein [Pedobacter sp. BS3]TZF81805.1 hypothetical protein FW774_17260 [Pedobacter sp. BS3]